jgi:uncharacterized membrane protein YjgN (DUF898 family)
MHDIPVSPAPNKPPVSRVQYSGVLGILFRTIFVNIFLAIATLGVYRFWGRTKLRRYIWGRFRVGEEPFLYLGTGAELFKSFLKFSLLFGLPIFVLPVCFAFGLHGTPFEPILKLFNTLLGFYLFALFAYARFSALRYRASRTAWRGIRFQLTGVPRQAVWIQVRNWALNLLTLFLYKPMADVAYFSYVANRVRFGDLKLVYKPQLDELQQFYFKCWLLVLPTFGFSLLWYKAKFYAHIAKYTRLGPVEFRCNITGRELFFLIAGNLLALIFTLGIAYPWVLHRRFEFFAEHFRFRGDLKYESIGQATKRSGAEGAEMFLGGDDFGF